MPCCRNLAASLALTGSGYSVGGDSDRAAFFVCQNGLYLDGGLVLSMGGVLGVATTKSIGVSSGPGSPVVVGGVVKASFGAADLDCELSEWASGS